MNSRMARIHGPVMPQEIKFEMLRDILCQLLPPPHVALHPHLHLARLQQPMSVQQEFKVRLTQRHRSLVQH